LLKSNVIALETTNPDVWDAWVSLHYDETEMWIGDIIEEYDNYWGFHFKPDTIVIAQIKLKEHNLTYEK